MHRLHPDPIGLSLDFNGGDEALTESTDKFLRNLFGSERAVPPVGVLGVVRDLKVLLRGGVGAFAGSGRCCRTLNTVVSILLSKTVESEPFINELLNTPLFELDSDDCMLYSCRKLLISKNISWIVSHFPIFIFSSLTLL